MRHHPLRAVAFALLALAFVVAVGAAPAHAQSYEQIRSYDVDVQVARDGTIDVTERILYDFGAASRHGIYRDFVTAQSYDPALDPDPHAQSVRRDVGWWRRYPLEIVSVSSDAPAKYVLESVSAPSGGPKERRLRIGDKNQYVTGQHLYTIHYRQKGAVNALPGDDVLNWNIIGQGWTVPIARATVVVRADSGPPSAVSCFAGPTRSTATCPAGISQGAASASTTGLGSFEGVTVAVTIPDTDGPEVEPVKYLDEKWSMRRAFDVTPWTVLGAVLTAVVALGGVALLLYRVGRDRRVPGAATDVAFSGASEAGTRPVGLFEHVATPVEFVPPDGLHPAQLGVIVDETADTVDVSATIVDLAVRGYLRIEEVTDDRGKVTDHRLVRLSKNEGLLTYEHVLLQRLFESGPVVELSSLKNHFASDLAAVKDELYQDSVDHGYFARRPDQVRQKWLAIGFAALLAGAALLVVTIALTHAALVAAPVALAGLALAIGGHFMPRRTARGTGAYRRALGFKDFIVNSEAHRAQFAERQNLFTEYLPFAIIFGCTDRWARTFESLGYQPDTSAWWVGSSAFALSSLGSSLSSFTASANTLLASTPGSSGGGGGGGFSGGGGGGGGGGSW